MLDLMYKNFKSVIIYVQRTKKNYFQKIKGKYENNIFSTNREYH